MERTTEEGEQVATIKRYGRTALGELIEEEPQPTRKPGESNTDYNQRMDEWHLRNLSI